jgi:hypothetical protein
MKDETHLHFDQKKEKTLDLLATFFMFLGRKKERRQVAHPTWALKLILGVR